MTSKVKSFNHSTELLFSKRFYVKLLRFFEFGAGGAAYYDVVSIFANRRVDFAAFGFY